VDRRRRTLAEKRRTHSEESLFGKLIPCLWF
jgi:hypothetical protein